MLALGWASADTSMDTFAHLGMRFRAGAIDEVDFSWFLSNRHGWYPSQTASKPARRATPDTREDAS